MTLAFTLPLPPSVNSMFINSRNATGRGRFPSPAYKAWKREAGEQLMQQYVAYGAPAIHKPVALSLRLGMDYRGDISNRLKAVEDLLTAHLDMPDDRWIDRIVMVRDQSVEGVIVTVEGCAVI